MIGHHQSSPWAPHMVSGLQCAKNDLLFYFLLLWWSHPASVQNESKWDLIRQSITISFHTWLNLMMYIHILKGVISTCLSIWFMCGGWNVNIFYIKRENEWKWDAFLLFNSLSERKKKLYKKLKKKYAFYGEGAIAGSTIYKWFTKLKMEILIWKTIVDNQNTEDDSGHAIWDISDTPHLISIISHLKTLWDVNHYNVWVPHNLTKI